MLSAGYNKSSTICLREGVTLPFNSESRCLQFVIVQSGNISYSRDVDALWWDNQVEPTT
jgi:hypothetical protein